MKKTYELTVGKLKRTLPIIPISETTAIASFVLLGDAELATYAAKKLIAKITTPFDCIITLESKGIPLAQELSRESNHPKFVVLRKSIKAYMSHPLEVKVQSITTTSEQKLVLNGDDAAFLQGKKVVLADDVISTGGSIQAAEQLLNKAGAKVVAKCAILAESSASQRDDILYLEKLPLFDA